jgi:hypothetical protein
MESDQKLCPRQLRELLDLHHLELRDQMFKFMKEEPLFDIQKNLGLSMKEQRALNHQRCLALVKVRSSFSSPLLFIPHILSMFIDSTHQCCRHYQVSLPPFLTSIILLLLLLLSSPLLSFPLIILFSSSSF